MKTTNRFENAVIKLYNAFHENRLNAMDCYACAVGNICDNKDDWKWQNGFYTESFRHASVSQINLANEQIEKTGYSRVELVKVEKLFMDTHKDVSELKHQQFKGLCAVVEYLAELDNIPNPMDYTKLFETENDKPKYELNFA
jgi:hypothetical protein